MPDEMSGLVTWIFFENGLKKGVPPSLTLPANSSNSSPDPLPLFSLPTLTSAASPCQTSQGRVYGQNKRFSPRLRSPKRPSLYSTFRICLAAVYIMRNAGLEEAQAGIKVAGRNISNLRYADDTTLMAESEEELKSLSMKVKESEKVGLKLKIQKTKIMVSVPITSWEIDGETVETVSDIILEGSKIIADGDCSHEIKRHLLLGRKAVTNLESILKSRDITLTTKVCLVKAMVFPLVMYGCESWTVKKAEH